MRSLFPFSTDWPTGWCLSRSAAAVLPLLLSGLAALAQAPTITALAPTRNLRNAPASTNVGVAFSQPMQNTTATQQALRIFSQQRGGRMFGTTGGVATVSSATITFNPTTNFKPGETVFVTTTTAARSVANGLSLARPSVHQFTVATGGTGTGIFVAPPTNPNPAVGTQPENVAMGDVDGDGDLDLLAANFGGNTVSVRLNTGSGNFSTLASSPTVGASPVSVALGDVDGDGDLDMLTANFNANTVSVRLNNGSGTFTAPATNPNPSVSTTPRSVAVGDIDGDGDLDLLAANFGTNTVSVRLNDGTGNFTAPATNPNPVVDTRPASVAVGDVDGDGDLDLLAASTQANTVSVRLNDGSGNFTAPATNPNPAVGTMPNSIAVGDVDADGDLDLVTTNYADNTVSVRLNNGSGNFTAPATNPNPAVGAQPGSVVLGDVDGDGDLDLLAANINDHTVSVRLNNGSGNFTAPATNPNPAVGTSPGNVAVGDVDGDGDLDFLTASAGANTVSVRLNVGLPTLTNVSPTSGIEGATVTLTGTEFTTATSVRFNGTAASFTINSPTSITATVPVGATTGPVTVTTPAATTTGIAFTVTPLTVTVLSPARNLKNALTSANIGVTFSQTLQNTTATQQAVRVFSQQRGGLMYGTTRGVANVTGNTVIFNPTNNFKPGETVFVTTTTAATATGGAKLARGHVHQITAAAGGSGTGIFAAPITGNPITGLTQPGYVETADIDGDGDLDMLTASASANRVYVYLNDGAAGFTSGQHLTTAAPSRIAVGDVDGDGDLDLLASNTNNSQVRVCLNNGAGVFTAGQTVSVGSFPYDVVLGDVDGDGDLDFMTACYSGQVVNVRLNDGTGTFSGTQDVSIGSQATNLAVGDIDNDGDLDLIVTTSTQAVRLLNDGTGVFSGLLGLGNSRDKVALGDIDGDGDLDLVGATNDSYYVNTNNGSGGFSLTQTLTIGSNADMIGLHDLDADGDLDLITPPSGRFVEIRLNNGAGNFAGARQVDIGNLTADLAVGDLDGDGDLDFGVTSYFSGTLSIRLNFAAPSLFSLTPTSGIEGASIVMSGANLLGATAVSFNGTPATSFTVNSATQMTVTVPAGATTGNVTVTTPGGTTNGVPFTVTPLTLTSVSPPRNQRNTATAANVSATFSQSLQNSTTTQEAVKVFSQQRGGLMYGSTRGTASVSGSTVTFNPANDFKPGETVLVTATTGITATGGGALRRGDVRQFTAAAGGTGVGIFAAPATGAEVATGNRPDEVKLADLNGDGNLDMLVSSTSYFYIQVKLNDGAGGYTSGQTLTISNPDGLTVGDVDGDGDLDILIGENNAVRILANNGTGTFSTLSSVALGALSAALAVGDVDGDGDLDLLACSFLADKVYVRLNDGSGTFNGSQEVLVGSGPVVVTLGDVDGDGDLDMVTGNPSNTMSVRYNDGSGIFSGSQSITGAGTRAVQLGDLDGDGDLDIAALTFGNIFISRNNGTGSFSAVQTLNTGVTGNQSDISLSDIDGDGDLDVVSAANIVWAWRNNGTGTFGSAQTLASTSSPYQLEMGDLDGDNDIDVVVVNIFNNTVSVRFNQGLPTLTNLTPATAAIGASITLNGTDLLGATAVSFNGTAATSFTVNSATSITVTVPVGATTGNVTVTTPVGTSNGQLFTLAPPTITGLAPGRNLRNAPRNSSVAVTFSQPMQNTAATQQAVQVFSQQHGGRMSGTTGGTATVSGSTITFDPAQDFLPGEKVQVTTTTNARAAGGAALERGHVHQFTTATGGTGTGSFSRGTGPNFGTLQDAVALGDVDGDGDLDQLTVVSNTVRISRNDGHGTFTNSSSVSVGWAIDLALGDLDGDGDLDFVTAVYDAGRGNTVSVRLNDGTGTFSNLPDVPVTTGPFRLTLGDIDGDGDLDLITINNAAFCSVRLNDGTGRFSTLQDLATVSGTTALALGDVDGDGDLDLLLAMLAQSSITVRLNDGTGLFGSLQTVGVGSTPRSIALGDLDGDGDLDLVSANSGASSVSIRLNNGTGSFSGGATVGVGSEPWGVALGDLDADGDLDLVSSNVRSGTTSVRFNDGAGNFSGTTSLGVGTQPRGLALGDLDADGDLDVVTSNYGASTTSSILFNNNAPTALSLSGSTVVENAGANAAVGTFSTTDADAGDTFTYTLVAGTGSTDNAAFVISGNTLQLLASADFELQSSYAIRVRTTDQAGGTFEQTFTISVTDVNEAPSLSPQTFSVAENAANGTVVGTVAGADPDAGATLTYSITAGNTGGVFAFVGNSLRVANSAALDYETTPTFTLTVQVSDGALTASATVTVNLTDEAESLIVSTPQTVPAGLYSDITVTSTGVATLGGAIVVNGPFRVQTGGVLDPACQAITGSGSFTLEAGATLAICSPQGISLFGATGEVQLTGLRSYSPEATYRYVGTVAQQTGSGLSRAWELEIANPAGVTLTRAVEIEQVLRLTSGTVITNDQLTLRSSATRQAYAVHAGGSSSGLVTVQRFVDGPATAGYRHLSSPVQASTVADLQTSSFSPRVNSAYNALPYVPVPGAQFPTIFGYNEARGGTNAAYADFNTGYYSPAALTDVLTRGRGWTVYMPGGKTPDFEGSLTTGNVALNLSVTGANTAPDAQKAGWHLLGNPYPQPIDWDLVTVGNGAGQTPATMSNGIAVYRTLGGNDGQYLTRTNGIGSLPDGLLAVGQGFFVRAQATSTVTFTNALRVEANPDPVARPTADSRPQVALTLGAFGAVTQDAAYVYFEAGATAGLDMRYDAARPGQNGGLVPTLSALTATGEAVAIDGLPTVLLNHGTTVELTLALPVAGVYQFGVADLRNLASTPVTLVDRLTSTRYDLAQVTTVAFRAGAGRLTGRFALEFGARVLGTAVEVATGSTLMLHPNPATDAVMAVRLSGGGSREAVTVYDVTGRLVVTIQTDTAGEATVEVANWSAGVYVVRTTTGRTARLVIE